MKNVQQWSELLAEGVSYYRRSSSKGNEALAGSGWGVVLTLTVTSDSVLLLEGLGTQDRDFLVGA